MKSPVDLGIWKVSRGNSEMEDRKQINRTREAERDTTGQIERKLVGKGEKGIPDSLTKL